MKVNYHGNVYDISSILDQHPGGRDIIEAHKNEVAPFIDGFHSDRARATLERLRIPGERAEVVQSRASFNFLARSASANTTKTLTVFDPHSQSIVYAGINPAPLPEELRYVHEQFRTWIASTQFPCVAAKSAVIGQASYALAVYPHELGTATNTRKLLSNIREFMAFQSEQWRKNDNYFSTFVAVFPQSKVFGKDLVNTDSQRLLQQWDALVNEDLQRNVRMSDLTRAYSMVALHPQAERVSHRFAYPALVFNAAEQFQHLNDTQEFDSIVAAVHRRDRRISGEEGLPENATIEFSVSIGLLNKELHSFTQKLLSAPWHHSASELNTVRTQLATYFPHMPNKGPVLSALAARLEYLPRHAQDQMWDLLCRYFDDLSTEQQVRLHDTLAAKHSAFLGKIAEEFHEMQSWIMY